MLTPICAYDLAIVRLANGMVKLMGELVACISPRCWGAERFEFVQSRMQQALLGQRQSFERLVFSEAQQRPLHLFLNYIPDEQDGQVLGFTWQRLM